MKKVLFSAAIAAMALSSCTDEKVGGNGPESTDNGIEFRTITEKGSRAPVTDALNISSFTVTGWWDKTATTATAGQNLYGDANADNGQYLFNAFAINKGEAANWAYTPVRYWPAYGNVDFFAYSPAGTQNLVGTVSNPGKGLFNLGDDEDGGTSLDNYITYIVPTIDAAGQKDAQEDFLVATSLNKNGKVEAPETPGDDGATVALNFQHALSRVKFAARKDVEGIEYRIGAIRLVGLNSTGDLNVTETVDGTNEGASVFAAAFAYESAATADPASDYTPFLLWQNQREAVIDVPPTYDHDSDDTTDAITSTAASRASGYALDFSASPVDVLFHDTNYSSVHGNTNAMMVMPQTTTPGVIYSAKDYTDGVDNIKNYLVHTPKPANAAAFYIVVSYKAFYTNGDMDGDNVNDYLYLAGGATGTDTEWKDKYIPVVLATAEETSPSSGEFVTVPLSFEIGRQYTINLTFGDRNNPEEDEALVPIDFDVTVSNWGNAGGINVR